MTATEDIASLVARLTGEEPRDLPREPVTLAHAVWLDYVRTVELYVALIPKARELLAAIEDLPSTTLPLRHAVAELERFLPEEK
jgi:hypothetical protein